MLGAVIHIISVSYHQSDQSREIKSADLVILYHLPFCHASKRCSVSKLFILSNVNV